jgi:hypothetical protein
VHCDDLQQLGGELMGGGGGGYSVGPNDMDAIKREVEERTKRSMAEAEINDLLARELARINFRDTETTSRHLDEISDALGDDVDVERLNFGGSIAKHTYVDGLSDVDSLLFLSGDDISSMSPAELRAKVETVLNERLAKGEISGIRAGNLAVTVSYKDGSEIQLVPAREASDGKAEISSADGSSWKAIEPRSFARTLTKVNQDQSGAVVPAIKLAKGIIAGLPPDSRLSGYHTEALAVAAFTGYTGSRTPREMLTHLFSSAAQAVKRPIADSTGQSRHIDESLGAAGSTERENVSRQLGQIAQRMEAATSAGEWRSIVEP